MRINVIQKVEAVIYIMADKFLNAKEMKQLKEELKMTRLGQMLYEDGKIEGKIEGRQEELIFLIRKKLEKGKTLNVIADEVESDLETVAVIIKEMGEVQKQGMQQKG